MALIDDMTQKIKSWGQVIRIHAPAEMLTCRICGQQYFSRGKNDIGICRECEAIQNAHCIGGAYDGEKANDRK